ncbi:hypothetical protein B0T13DRAFT_21072 [Neurospora crassa]|nr:hypothetical protein B0T13DRAFT_21072 [Neurospora crassa]
MLFFSYSFLQPLVLHSSSLLVLPGFAISFSTKSILRSCFLALHFQIRIADCTVSYVSLLCRPSHAGNVKYVQVSHKRQIPCYISLLTLLLAHQIDLKIRSREGIVRTSEKVALDGEACVILSDRPNEKVFGLSSVPFRASVFSIIIYTDDEDLPFFHFTCSHAF